MPFRVTDCIHSCKSCCRGTYHTTHMYPHTCHTHSSSVLEWKLAEIIGSIGDTLGSSSEASLVRREQRNSFVERCPLFGVSIFRGFTVSNMCHSCFQAMIDLNSKVDHLFKRVYNHVSLCPHEPTWCSL